MANGNKMSREDMERGLAYLQNELVKAKRNLRRYLITGVIAGLLGGGLSTYYTTKPRTAELRNLDGNTSYDLVVKSKLGKYPLLRIGKKYKLASDIFNEKKKKIKERMKDKKKKKKK